MLKKIHTSLKSIVHANLFAPNNVDGQMDWQLFLGHILNIKWCITKNRTSFKSNCQDIIKQTSNTLYFFLLILATILYFID